MKKYLTSLIIGAGVLFIARPVYAAIDFTLLPECTGSGNCSMCDFILLFINFADIIAAVCGSIALVMLIVGALFWILSFGNPERVKKGTDIMKQTFIALGILLFAWVGVNFIIHALSGDAIEDSRIFSRQWWDPDCAKSYPKSCDGLYIGDSCIQANYFCSRVKDDSVPDTSECGGDFPGCSCVPKCQFMGILENKSCSCAAECEDGVSVEKGGANCDEATPACCCVDNAT